MLTDDEIQRMKRESDSTLDFARSIEAAARKTCEVATAQALLHARADERALLIARCEALARDEEFGHLYSTGASECVRLLQEP